MEWGSIKPGEPLTGSQQVRLAKHGGARALGGG